MKNLGFVLILAGLIAGGFRATSFGTVREAQPITRSVILRAHGVSQESDLTSCDVVATKVQPFEGAPDGTEHNFFSQTVWLSVRAGSLRYGSVRLLDETTVTESYVFNGATYNHSVGGLEQPVNKTGDVGDSDSRLTLHRISQFGLQPFLRQLADPRTEATYLGRTASGNEMLKVQAASESWILCSDESGLIQKIESGSATLVFSAYRTVKGLRLPFNERVYNGQRLFYELGFIRIDPQPTIDGDSFNPPDPFKEILR